MATDKQIAEWDKRELELRWQLDFKKRKVVEFETTLAVWRTALDQCEAELGEHMLARPALTAKQAKDRK